jgi:DNA-binding PadR family transcriptional regulator
MFPRSIGNKNGRRHARAASWPHLAGHRGHGRPGGRGCRVFDHGDLRFVLFHLIAEKPRHGYELIKAIEEKFGGMYSPSPGVIYPTLTHLEELGYLRAETGGGTKKLYTITPEGRDFVAANQVLVDAILGRMEAASHLYGDGPAPEILQAMTNLRQALAARLSRGALDAEQIRTISGLLDRLAADIERG